MSFSYTTLWLLLSMLLTLIYFLKLSTRKSRPLGTARLPPGPPRRPVIGNILDIRTLPHQSLANLANTYGPIMSLKLGKITTIVVSSPSAAKQVLKEHDQIFSSRTLLEAVQVLDHPNNSVIWLPVNSKWRRLRKLCAMEIFSVQRVDLGQALRGRKVQELLQYVGQFCEPGRPVEIGRVVFTTSLNLLSNTIFSMDLAHYDSENAQEFKDLIWNIMVVAGKPNVADFFPCLRWVDPQGLKRKVTGYVRKLMDILEGLVMDRLKLGDSVQKNDVLDALLRLTKAEGSDLSVNDIVHLLLDLYVAGIETTSSTIEWAMAELLHNPKVLAKAKVELTEVIGKGKLVQESDIPKLTYLQAVIKETLRLHPPAPLLVPHKANSEVIILGFTIPKDAQVLVNVWAIGHDQNVWSNPDLFVPERFLELEIDVKGRDFELIPFGGGRRICLGLPLAYRLLHLTLASLLHSFGWKLEDGMGPQDMDMSEKYGFTLQKTQPLLAVPLKC